MQTYINDYHPSFTNLKTVKPNVKKVFIRNLLFAFLIALGIIGLLIYLQVMVGLDVFVMPLEAFQIAVNPNAILIYSILIFTGLVVIYMIFNYLTVMNLRYEFYKDKMILYEPVLWIFLTHKEIQYKNIVKISFNYQGFTNKLLNSGEITIDITGMREGFVKMQVIDDTEHVVEELLRIVKEYNAVQQMQFQENYKISSIMNKF